MLTCGASSAVAMMAKLETSRVRAELGFMIFVMKHMPRPGVLGFT
jgi:hypothetical protein